jgi:hypothetical protein
MLVAIGIIFLMLGILFSSFDIFLPTYTQEMLMMIFAMRIFGMMFEFLGLVIIGARAFGTGANIWMDLPSDKWINLIHSHIRGKDPDAKFMKARRLDLETLKCKNKLFKDVGGGFRIGGHSSRRTYETIGFTMPDWLSEYFHKVKEDFGLTNSDEFRALKTALKLLTDPKKPPFKSIEEQLKEIELLKPIMKDEVNKHALLDMDINKLKNLEYIFYDGITHNGDEVELFIDSATPNEIDLLSGQTILNELRRNINYNKGQGTDWGKWMPWLIVLMIGAVVAMMILKGM